MIYASQNQNHFGVWRLARLNDWRTINILLIILTALLFVGYIAVNNSAAEDGFKVRALEKRMAELQNQKRQLDMDMLNRQAMETVEARAQELGFVPVSQVDYLTTGQGAVAMR
ncbi:MAG: hypothetical protein PHT12_04755 [Patescibacteria group bacterium]|nr:hypothetical protein [Patescibacteria group bacterium]